MKPCSRVVCVVDEHKGKTGTIIDIVLEYNKPYVVKFDDGTKQRFKINEIIEIDDITNIGKIKFKEGMYIYDVHLNLVGKIVEIKTTEEITMQKIEWEDNTSSYTYLDENYNYIVIDERYLTYGTKDKFEILMKKSINPKIDLYGNNKFEFITFDMIDKK